MAKRDKRAVIKWLSEYVKIETFLDFMLEGGLDTDEKLAFTMFKEMNSEQKS